MKHIVMFLILSFSTLILISCQSQTKEMTLLDNVSGISISKSNGYGGLNENYFASYSQEESISDFEEILKNAKGNTQDVTNETPTYDILVRYENGDTHGLHLILGNEGEESVFMYIGYEESYTVSPEDTYKLENIIVEEEAY
ncbi:hypothetical protein AEA09_10450 [Lysinibacillus contaminans]|uniref:YhfM-like domain-containing protein n=1 Tax=Lysinibacillus contaminans TaxID=1293441 RepID=A0ABR5K202_9BACI|nr:hypothetical protein [Lysinibacillus contaminans]KOS68923.1 hypothetical protein AEA09_10450 [Lysinibacillus contaminans]